MANETETKTITMEELQAMMSKTSKEAVEPLKVNLADFENRLKAAYRIDNGPVKPAEVLPAGATLKTTDVAKLEDTGIANMQVFGLPLGQAVVGGFVAVFATELVDGLMSKQKAYVRGAVKLGAAWAINKWGKKIPFMGEGGVKAVALLLTFDAIRDFIPIDTYAQGIAAKISGKVANAGLAGPKAFKTISANTPAASGYYSKMFGN